MISDGDIMFGDSQLVISGDVSWLKGAETAVGFRSGDDGGV